jgi:hypothetical protein
MSAKIGLEDEAERDSRLGERPVGHDHVLAPAAADERVDLDLDALGDDLPTRGILVVARRARLRARRARSAGNS